MIKKANIIKVHLKKSIDQLIIVANIGPTMAVFKLYEHKRRRFSQTMHDSLKFGRHRGTNTSIMAASKPPVAAILFSM